MRVGASCYRNDIMEETSVINTSRVALQKHGCQSYRKTVEDENDVFAERINTVLLLFLGVLLVTGSVVLVTYSAVLVISQQQFLMEFLKTLAIATPLLVIGLGLLYYHFQNWRIGRASNSFTQGPSEPLCILCENCSAILYEGTEHISPNEIIQRYSGRCPECGEKLRARLV